MFCILIGLLSEYLEPSDRLDFGIFAPLARQGISITWAYNSVIAASRTLTTTCSYFSYSNNFNDLAFYTTEEMAKVEIGKIALNAFPVPLIPKPLSRWL